MMVGGVMVDGLWLVGDGSWLVGCYSCHYCYASRRLAWNRRPMYLAAPPAPWRGTGT